MDVPDNNDEGLDPRIQIELENLNDATDDINKLESELDEAHTAFRQLLSETTKRLKEILNKVGSSYVERARCYYEALEIARQAQIKCQQQAQLFQRASEIHAAAKETVALAESRFISHQHEWNFDQAWQDMLNHATLKVMDAENQKAECGREHYRRAVLFHDAEKRLLQLEEKHRRAIIKARPYFEVKAQCDQMLATQKERVECLQKAIQDAKTNYATSLRQLEEISNQIHQQRKDYDFIANGPREPGVGAELVSPQKTSNYDLEFNQLNDDRIKDNANDQLNKFNKVQDCHNNYDLQEDSEHLGKRSVDGSEATSQWELELESNLENLNSLSLEDSINDPDSRNENKFNLHFYNEKFTKSSNFLQKLSYSFLKSKEHSVYNLDQLKKLSKNFQTFKNASVSKSLRTHLEELNTVQNKICDSSTKVRTLSSSSQSPEKGENRSIIKYVPNTVFKFGFSNKKSQSNSDINLPSNFDTNSTEKYQSLDNIVADKTDNFESDKKRTNLNHTIINETCKNGLNIHCTRLSNDNTTNSESTRKWFRSKSSQFLFSNTSTSPIKVEYVDRLSSENSLNKQIVDNSYKACAAKKLTNSSLNIRELPLLSVFEKSNILLNSKNKSHSMINLGDSQNFKSLDDLYLCNLKTASIEKMINLKDNHFQRFQGKK
ncbi:uncharacterized protein LOC100881374 [Megachile rotundata]|uniref:uncharacterized protein LOC100881374 n=1 Tax=Megachile rotundata TaxID=143995 RepID=UPI000258D488|nr:PREDICTED: uncharacterized protein PF11_0213 [Megachile rotundata]